jgi:hypothetical protein
LTLAVKEKHNVIITHVYYLFRIFAKHYRTIAKVMETIFGLRICYCLPITVLYKLDVEGKVVGLLVCFNCQVKHPVHNQAFTQPTSQYLTHMVIEPGTF